MKTKLYNASAYILKASKLLLDIDRELSDELLDVSELLLIKIEHMEMEKDDVLKVENYRNLLEREGK